MEEATGRILVVDDDGPLLKLMSAYLTRLGNEVVACASAEEAWKLMEATPSDYRLALVDLNMPGMGGEELTQRILACHTTIRVIVTSGYPAELTRLQALDRDRVSFLHKPFAPQQLAEAVGRPPAAIG